MDQSLHPRVLELIASRICHDLVSPVGAISNGVELMEELGKDAGEEAVQLIASSAQQASVRLKAFRLTYGAAGTDKNIGLKDIRDTFMEIIGGGRVKVEFEQDLGVKFSMPPRGFFKVLLNLLILAEECNKGEGTITVSAFEGSKGIRIVVAGNNASFRDGAEDALEGRTSPEDLDPRSVHPYVTGKFAISFGLQIKHSAKKDPSLVEFILMGA
jgi:histidine phosphotransferase ChpT